MAKKSIKKRAIPTSVQPEFFIDNNGWIISKQPDGGILRSQSVEAQLLFTILQRLEAAARR